MRLAGILGGLTMAAGAAFIVWSYWLLSEPAGAIARAVVLAVFVAATVAAAISAVWPAAARRKRRGKKVRAA